MAADGRPFRCVAWCFSCRWLAGLQTQTSGAQASDQAAECARLTRCANATVAAVVHPEELSQSTRGPLTKQRSGSVHVLESQSGGDDVEIIRADAHNVTGVELSAPAQLRLTVDGHVTAGDKGLGIRPARGSTGKLE